MEGEDKVWCQETASLFSSQGITDIWLAIVMEELVLVAVHVGSY